MRDVGPFFCGKLLQLIRFVCFLIERLEKSQKKKEKQITRKCSIKVRTIEVNKGHRKKKQKLYRKI